MSRNSQAPSMIWAKTAKLWTVVNSTSATSAMTVSSVRSRSTPRAATPALTAR